MDFIHLLNGGKYDAVDISLLIDTARLADVQKFLLHSKPLMSSVFGFIEAHYQDFISLRDVAKAVDRSPAYLTDLVRRETGKTVLNWIVERRMTEARRLLLESGKSVENIAECVGYLDKRHFSRQFIRHHGKSPGVWRKTYKNRSIPPLQMEELQNLISSNLIKQKAAAITVENAQRLQICAQEIATVLEKNNY